MVCKSKSCIHYERLQLDQGEDNDSCMNCKRFYDDYYERKEETLTEIKEKEINKSIKKQFKEIRKLGESEATFSFFRDC